ncbi:MAG: winged helix-turn-helix transcriptional regulator [Brevundimonas sp.]|nr:MAG: winged helix-turn-helix transcriptional regulator [Brevundimonas sp.]
MITADAPTLDALEQSAAHAAALLKSLANEHRLMILCQLGTGEMQVAQILSGVKLSQSALSQHLARLREDGLVATRREGVAIFYRIDDPAVLKVIATLAEIYCPSEKA